MLSNPILLACGTFAALVLYWTIPETRPKTRQSWLTSVSMILVYLYAPGGFLFCAILAAVPMAMQVLYRRTRGAWALWLGLVLAVLPLIASRTDDDIPFIYTFGIAFATVKSIGLVMTVYGGRTPLRWRDATFLIFYFPLFTVGPVEKVQSFTETAFSNRFDLDTALRGLWRIGFGLFLVYFVCSDVLSPIRENWFGRSEAAIANFGVIEAWGLVIASFMFTYLNFVGFTEIALGLSLLFGIRALENFDWPLLVTNIGAFWRRYHISMGNWINQFIYFPVVLLFKKPWAGYVGSVVAFVIFGLWHAFTINYFLWGLFNGLAIIAYQYSVKAGWIGWLVGRTGKRFVGVLGGMATLAYVGTLQTIGNLPSLKAALMLLARMVGA